MSTIELQPAAEVMTRLLAAIDDAALDAPTPCEGYRLDGLVDHVGGFAMAFTAAAAKDLGPLTSQPPAPGPVTLESGWRDRIARDLVALVEAWRAPDAWEGMTRAGGVDLPGNVAGRVALDELVVHGWDVARSTGQPFDCDADSLREVEATVRMFRDGNDGEIPGLFGPVVPVPKGAPPLDVVIGLTGRDPNWPG